MPSGRFYADPDSDDDGDNPLPDAPTTSSIMALQDSRTPLPWPDMADISRNCRPGSFANEALEAAEDDNDMYGS